MMYAGRFPLIFTLIIFSIASLAQNTLDIIPMPEQIISGKGHFELKKSTRIMVDAGNTELKKNAGFLADFLKNETGISPVIAESNSRLKPKNAIILTLNGATSDRGKEGYSLRITDKTVTIQASAPQGIFYGVQSLMQIVYSVSGGNTSSVILPATALIDSPRFPYRGLHLDVGRHLFPVEFIKKYIDLMAFYKYNTFHWHLTEDQGWRIEIKKYPLLTSVGSIRKGTQIRKSNISDTIPYGGYYTQDEAREIVEYAASKYITVIPEIEMPGHSVAALAAYPNLSCTGGPFEVRTLWGVSDDIYCAGNDSVFIFLQEVLDEVLTIFPSKYIHIGGDEAPKERWQHCAKCQARIHTEGLKDEMELQSWFIRKMEKFLNSRGRKIIGWDEILEGGLAPDATVMSWRGLQGGIDAASQNHDVIMTPVDYCYFDYYQSDPANEPLSIGGNLTLKTVYSFEPVPPVLDNEQAKHIIGTQGNVWTEYVRTPAQVELKVFPRALALSEVAWSSKQNKNWDNFLERLDTHFTILKKRNVNFGNLSAVVSITPSPDTVRNLSRFVLSSEYRGMDIRFTTDGTDPVVGSSLYTNPVIPEESCIIKAALFREGKTYGPIKEVTYKQHLASGKPVTYLKPYSFKYPASGNRAMTDGALGLPSYKNGNWQGYEGSDMEFVVDLMAAINIHKISLNVVQDAPSWVLFPLKITIETSPDGTLWEEYGLKTFDNQPATGQTIIPVSFNSMNSNVRYIRVTGLSPKILPDWHPYAGHPCWIFTDEVVVE